MEDKMENTVIVVDSDGVLITAVGMGGTLTVHSHDAKKVAAVKQALRSHKKFSLVFGAADVPAADDTFLGIFAALTAGAPNRTFLREAPEELLNQISSL